MSLLQNNFSQSHISEDDIEFESMESVLVDMGLEIRGTVSLCAALAYCARVVAHLDDIGVSYEFTVEDGDDFMFVDKDNQEIIRVVKTGSRYVIWGKPELAMLSIAAI